MPSRVPFTPIAGIALCLLLMFSLPPENWIRLAVWLLIGFLIYFGYGRHHSVMKHQLEHMIAKHGLSPAGMPATHTEAEPGDLAP